MRADYSGRQPRRSLGYSRPRSSGDAGRGETSTRSSSPSWIGSTGGTTSGCSTAGQRPARRVRKPLSSTQQHPSHDGWTCVTSSPGFPGRFTFCSHRFRSILRERAPLLLATVAAVPSKAVAFDDELAAGRVADAQRTSVVAKSGDNALSGTMMRARRAAGANEDVADRLEHNRFFRGRMLARTRRGGTTL